MAEKTLRDELTEKRQMLLIGYRNWQIGLITSDEYTKYAEEFVDSILSALQERVKGTALTEEQIDEQGKEFWVIVTPIKKDYAKGRITEEEYYKRRKELGVENFAVFLAQAQLAAVLKEME